MKQLILIRHAHANKLEATSDMQAKLTLMGKRQAETIGKMIHQWQIDNVLVSPAKRAVETLEVLLNYFDPTNITQSRKIYEGELNDILNLIYQTTDKVNTLMIVGHNPTIYQLVLYLAKNDNDFYTSLEEDGISTAELILLEFNQNNSWLNLPKNSGNIKHIFNPNAH